MPDKEMRIGGKHFCKRCGGYHGTALNECRDLEIHVNTPPLPDKDKTVTGYASNAVPMEAILTWDELIALAKFASWQYDVDVAEGYAVLPSHEAVKATALRILAQKEEKP